MYANHHANTKDSINLQNSEKNSANSSLQSTNTVDSIAVSFFHLLFIPEGLYF